MSRTRLARLEDRILDQEPVCPYLDEVWSDWIGALGQTPRYALDLVAESVRGRSDQCPPAGGCAACAARANAIRRWATGVAVAFTVVLWAVRHRLPGWAPDASGFVCFLPALRSGSGSIGLPLWLCTVVSVRHPRESASGVGRRRAEGPEWDGPMALESECGTAHARWSM